MPPEEFLYRRVHVSFQHDEPAGPAVPAVPTMTAGPAGPAMTAVPAMTALPGAAPGRAHGGAP